jgi:hypothetical protein
LRLGSRQITDIVGDIGGGWIFLSTYDVQDALLHEAALRGRRLVELGDEGVQAAAPAFGDGLGEWQQRGINSRAYVPGPLSPLKEYNVDSFVHWYVDKLRAQVQDNGVNL